MSKFWCESSSISILCVCEQRLLWFSVHLHRLARAFAARQCDKYQNIMCWHIICISKMFGPHSAVRSTPASNLGYLASPRTIFNGCQIVHLDPLDAKRRCPKINWYGLCEKAWFPWQPISDLRMGACLQKYSYLSCNLS